MFRSEGKENSFSQNFPIIFWRQMHTLIASASAPPVFKFVSASLACCGSKRDKPALFRSFRAVMRLCFKLKTAKIIAKTHENSLSKLWDEAKVRFVAVSSRSFASL